MVCYKKPSPGGRWQGEALTDEGRQVEPIWKPLSIKVLFTEASL